MRGYFSLKSWKRSLTLTGLTHAFFGALGLLWLITEIVTFFSKIAGQWMADQWILFICLAIIYTLFSNRPRFVFSYRLAGRDVNVEISVYDALSISGALVVPSNTSFDTDLEGLIPRSPSIQSKILHDSYAGNVAHLDMDLEESLAREGYSFEPAPPSKPGKNRIYTIGTVAQIVRDGRIYYFLAHTHVNESGRATGTSEDLRVSLSKLWYYISESGDKGDIVIPLLGTGHARIPLRREQVFREIVDSFVASCSEKNYCNRLTISFLPEDVAKYGIDLNVLDEYLRYTCTYAEFDLYPYSGAGKPTKG